MADGAISIVVHMELNFDAFEVKQNFFSVMFHFNEHSRPSFEGQIHIVLKNT